MKIRLDNTDNDAIGISVCGLGMDGNGYLMEDLTLKAGRGPAITVATNSKFLENTQNQCCTATTCNHFHSCS